MYYQNARGIDFSHWQGEIDFPALLRGHNVRHNIDFGFAKSSTGAGGVDPRYERNVTEWGKIASKRIRMPALFSAYHWLTPDSDPSDQLYHFLDVTDYGRLIRERWVMPPMLDVEEVNIPEGFVKVWTRQAHATLGCWPIIYTRANIFNIISREVSPCPCFVAHYGAMVPSVPIAFKDAGWDFWQYTDRGRVDGIGGGLQDVDCDIFNGTRAGLHTWVKQAKGL